jgi:pimeloyl-ACP methyl ester carboxylesterase
VPDTFLAPDGLRLAYRRLGSGRPLVCIPGGPGRNPDYFDDLGGIPGRELIFLEPRGTGSSEVPAGPATYRVDRMTSDVEALREHLGLDRIDLLAHSAGADLAILYAARFPDQIARLVLIAPSLETTGLDPSDEEFHALLERRSAEPWYADARAALAATEAGDLSPQTRQRWRPFLYGRWDDAARTHATAPGSTPDPVFVRNYYAEGGFDVEQTRAALAKVSAPVLVYACELDLRPTPAAAAELAALFPDARVVVQPGAAHFPWLDDPAWCGRALADFLGVLPGAPCSSRYAPWRESERGPAGLGHPAPGQPLV